MTLEEATRVLADAGIESPRGEARLLLAHALGVSRDASLTATPTPAQSAAFAAYVARRAARLAAAGGGADL
ncbi:MAG: peptide chain release factor N(5)-glutamine methyltransferase, partial [Pseudomonadota bacterium]